MQTPTCSMRANTVSVHSTQTYAEALQIDAQVSGGGLGWSFSASGDYAKTSQALNSYSRTQYQTTMYYVLRVHGGYACFPYIEVDA